MKWEQINGLLWRGRYDQNMYEVYAEGPKRWFARIRLLGSLNDDWRTILHITCKGPAGQRRRRWWRTAGDAMKGVEKWVEDNDC